MARPWRSHGWRPWPLLAGLALLTLFVVLNLRWVRRHVLAAPAPWDQGLYLWLSLRYLHAWEEGGTAALLREVRELAEPQPPLLPLTAVPLYPLFGDGRPTAYATSSLYGCLLLGAAALLARRRAGDGGALLALFLAATFSAPLMLSRDYQMDLPGAALLSAAVVALERCDGFRHRGWSIAGGALAGLMVLAKTMAGPFLAGPALYLLVCSWRGADRLRVAVNTLLALGVAAGLAAVWWGPHLGAALHYLLYYGWGEGADPYDPTAGGSLLSLRSLGYYLVAFGNDGASVPYLMIATAVLAAEARRWFRAEARPPLDGLLWTWLLAAYVLLTFARNKASDRYLIFLIPPAVVLLTTALLRQPAPWRRLAVAAALVAGLTNYVGHTWASAGVRLLKWSPPWGLEAYVPRQTWLRTGSAVPEGYWPMGSMVATLGAARMTYQEHLRTALVERALAGGPLPPEEQVRHAFRALLRREPDEEALRLAVSAMRDGTRTVPQQVAVLAASPEAAMRPLRVLVLPDHVYVNASTLGYQAEWSRAPVTFARIEPGTAPPELEDYDAVVFKTDIEGPSKGPAAEALERLQRSRFRLLPDRFPCPDGSEVRVFVLAAPVG